MTCPRCRQSTACTCELSTLASSMVTVSGLGTSGSPYILDSTERYGWVRRTTPQTINNITDTTLSWEAAIQNPHGLWSAGTPTRLTAGEAGWWVFECTMLWDTNGTGYRQSQFMINSATPVPYGATRLLAHTSGLVVQMVGAARLPLATDHISVKVFQNSGAARTILADSTFSAHKPLPL